MQLLVYPVTVFVWFTLRVNHTMSWSKILIPGWICHGEQNACHVVYYCRRQVPVYAWLSYLSFKASESDHFAMVAVTRCRRSFFYLVFRSSLLLRSHTLAFLQSACLQSTDYSVELCSHRQHFMVQSFSAGRATLKRGVIIDSLCGHISPKSFIGTFFILNFCLYHMLSKKIT